MLGSRGAMLDRRRVAQGGGTPPATNYELREDGSRELREDGSKEVRE